MEDTKLFAQDCADFFKKRMFTPNVKPEDMGYRIDAVVYLMARHLLSGLPQGPSIDDFVMGTRPPSGPHFGLLIEFLRNVGLPEHFSTDIPAVKPS
jgi:hypothetical protein